MPRHTHSPSRRRVLQGIGASAAALAAPRPPWAAAAGSREQVLHAAPAEGQLLAPPRPATEVWSYNGQLPGPELRLRQGQRLQVRLRNGLAEPTSLHWHGLRVPNAMDGVPGLTQPAVAPGEEFLYDFLLPDAGTYWYHPHRNSAEQVARGLYGALIVEEPDPPRVDRDLVWMLDDWRITPGGQLAGGYDNRHEQAHGGRLGNLVTVNGQRHNALPVRAGERLRLRLINAANARIFLLRFDGHQPRVIAYDGQPVAPHSPEDDLLLLGPGMRADLIIDLAGEPGQRYAVSDHAYPDQPFAIGELVYAEGAPLRETLLETPIALAANPLPRPDLAAAEPLELILEGGAMGGMRQATLGGRRLGMRELAAAGRFWALNGVAAGDGRPPQLAALRRGASYRMRLVNRSRWPHPMHLHGHSFRILSRDGRPSPREHWADSLLMLGGEEVEIAFVADNPGDWLFHCHILEHAAAGMSALLRVG